MFERFLRKMLKFWEIFQTNLSIFWEKFINSWMICEKILTNFAKYFWKFERFLIKIEKFGDFWENFDNIWENILKLEFINSLTNNQCFSQKSFKYFNFQWNIVKCFYEILRKSSNLYSKLSIFTQNSLNLFNFLY